jgi:hypothetical protein
MENNRSYLSVLLTEDGAQTAKWRVMQFSVFLSEDHTQTGKWRITAVSCLFFSVKTVHRPPNRDRLRFSVFLSETRTQTGKWRITAVSRLLFSVKTVQGLSRAMRLLLHTCCSSYRLVHRQQYAD